VPDNFGVRTPEDWDTLLSGVAAAVPVVLPSMLEDDADAAAAAMLPAPGPAMAGIPETSADAARNASDRGSAPGTATAGDAHAWFVAEVDATHSSGPPASREPMAHLWFGWSWAVGGLVNSVVKGHFSEAVHSTLRANVCPYLANVMLTRVAGTLTDTLGVSNEVFVGVHSTSASNLGGTIDSRTASLQLGTADEAPADSSALLCALQQSCRLLTLVVAQMPMKSPRPKQAYGDKLLTVDTMALVAVALLVNTLLGYE